MSNQETETSRNIMRPLRLQYLRDLTERQKLLEKFLKKLEKAELETQESAALLELAHKFSGTGATYGFPQISDSARYLEILLTAQSKPMSDVLSGTGKNGLSKKQCDILLMLTHKLSLSGNASWLEKVNKAAAHLEIFLNSEIKVPSTLIFLQLELLMEACITALDQEPGSFSKVSAGSTPPIAKKERQMPLVLIVDGDKSVRELLSAHIAMIADVIMSADAREALELITHEKPDLVLLDDTMSGAASGIKLLEGLRDSPVIKDTPVVMISASDHPDTIERAFNAGAVDYITKPFDPKQVGVKIKERLKWLGTNILIVDDDKTICDMMSRALAVAGFVTQTVGDGQLALDMMEQSAPDLVLLDWMLPSLEGPEVLDKMREIPELEQVPVIFITARKEYDDMLAGIDMDVADYVVKPFNPNEVVACCIGTLASIATQSAKTGQASKMAS